MAKRVAFHGSDGLEALRERLPGYWWSEVDRVRALVADDAEEAFREAKYFEYAAQALVEAGEGDALLHARALCAASQQLTRLASAHVLRN